MWIRIFQLYLDPDPYGFYWIRIRNEFFLNARFGSEWNYTSQLFNSVHSPAIAGLAGCVHLVDSWPAAGAARTAAGQLRTAAHWQFTLQTKHIHYFHFHFRVVSSVAEPEPPLIGWNRNRIFWLIRRWEPAASLKQEKKESLLSKHYLGAKYGKYDTKQLAIIIHL